MNINKHNYEAFFLDYHEGNLTPQQVAELLLFVEQHPELKEEFESFENFSLEDFSTCHFDNKEQLRKEITEQNKEEYFIRSVDGTLNKAETELLDIYLKQHPQFSFEFELFQKTKLTPDLHVVFENKAQLKKTAETADNLLIAAVEGLLTNEERILLKQQLSADAELRRDLALFQQTKLSADPSVVFENKEELKRKERKIIPLFYYASAIAAAVLILFGLFFLFSQDHAEKQPMAKNDKLQKQEPLRQKSSIVIPDINAKTVAVSYAKKENVKKKNSVSAPEADHLKANPVVSEPEDLTQTNTANKPEVPQEPVISNNSAIPDPVNSNSVAKAESPEKAPSKEFLSLGQIAAKTIKEKTLDPEVLAMEKKSGRLKKFSGWDALQVIAKGINKVTGAKVEAKPTYNEEGEVTAYALGAGGFQISRGK